MDCDLIPVDDAEMLDCLLRQAGADPIRDVAAKVVIPGHVRMVFVWYDPLSPTTSSWRVANQAAALVGDGERVRLRLENVRGEDHRKRIVLDVAKASYAHSPIQDVHDIQNIKEIQNSKETPKILFYGFDEREGRAIDVVLGAVRAASDLENAPSNVVGPPDLARIVSGWFKGHPKVVAKLLGPSQLEKEGLGLILGSGRAGDKPPCMLVLEMIRDVKANTGKKDKKDKKRKERPLIVMVGKGVTYDSGGLRIKPMHAMYGMHGDKTGAAVAGAVMLALCESGVDPGFDVVTLLPSIENLINEKAVRPGDVLTACDGTKVEVVDPDAEGRLILGDAMAYAVRKYGDRIKGMIDFATLTGTASYAHPGASTAFYCEDDALSAAVERAGETWGEFSWRLPTWGNNEFNYQTKSSIADLKNAGWESSADGYMAAVFLRHFVARGDHQGPLPFPWVHIDIYKNSWSLDNSGKGKTFVGSGVALGLHTLLSFSTTKL
jgi:leucyl aminopeptidase